MFNVIDLRSGWKIDLVIRKDRAFSREEFSRRVLNDELGHPVPIATAEDTIIAKLEAAWLTRHELPKVAQWSKASGGSERQRRDIRGIVESRGEQLDGAYLEKWIESLGLRDEWQAARA